MVKNRLKTVALLVLTLVATMATAQTVNMSKYITLTVTQGEQIRLNLWAAAAGTPVKIVSGSTDTVVTVGTSWTGYQSYTAGATTMTVYGDITNLDCSLNGAKLTALNVRNNTALIELYCYGNQLTALDVTQNTALTRLDCSNNQLTALNVTQNMALTGLNCGGNQLTALNVTQNTALTKLWCYGNQLTALDVTQNTALTHLYCRNNQLTAIDVSQNMALIEFNCIGNQLTALDVSQNTALTELYCERNQLTALNVSQNTALTELWCQDNQLTALDVTQNTALTRLGCYGNSFTTQAFDDLMCSLPARTAAADAKFYPLYNASDADTTNFMATASQIATGKNWQVRYGNGSGTIRATSGTYTCPTTTGIGEVASVALTLYPNPATDILTIETKAIGAAITITDLTGRTVMTATATDGNTTLRISHLSAGTYMVRVGDKVGKVVKR